MSSNEDCRFKLTCLKSTASEACVRAEKTVEKCKKSASVGNLDARGRGYEPAGAIIPAARPESHTLEGPLVQDGIRTLAFRKLQGVPYLLVKPPGQVPDNPRSEAREMC